MAQHPLDKDIIATGQMAAKGRSKKIDVFVWKASTQEVLAHLTGFHRRAVNVLAFSPNGGKLLTIGQDDQHSAAIYDWSSQSLLCTTKTGGDKVISASWKNESEFMTVDPTNVKFFKCNGKNVTSKKGILGTHRNALKKHTCGAYVS